jgi:hypothetical protein
VNTRAWIVFLDESGVSLLPQIRRTYSPRAQTPFLRHRLNWKRASMAGALGYHSTDPDRGARLCAASRNAYDSRLCLYRRDRHVGNAGEQQLLQVNRALSHGR